MFKTILIPFVLPLVLLFSNGSDRPSQTQQSSNRSDFSASRSNPKSTQPTQSTAGQTGTLEKMIVANGSAAMSLDLGRLNGSESSKRMSTLRFSVAPNSFFPILVFNKLLRGPLQGTMELISQDSVTLPAPLNASLNQLVIEKIGWTEEFDLVVRDGKTGFTYFNIEGNLYEYDSKNEILTIEKGRLLISKEFANALGRANTAGSMVGMISVNAVMRATEITHMVDGEIKSVDMPSIDGNLVSGPDVIVGDLSGLQQFGSSGTQVGLAVGTDSCNAGAEPLHWFALPNNDHPVIPQNLYRMSGGSSNNERFEQVGQSWLKHAFTALQQNICGFGCQSSGTGTLLGAGCSDPYSASLNGSQNSLGSRAWVNPFTGSFPGSNPSPNSHTSHTHNGTSHRILVDMSDLNTTQNPGATYFAEAQYVTPHEYAWCQAHPGECNMYNNASYRQYSVTGTTSFSFSPVGSTVRSKPAVFAWFGATINQVEPAPGVDGIAFVAYKVTNPSPGVWHYEYAVYNQNLDRAIQSFTVPIGTGAILSNVGFHMPPQFPAFLNDGTLNSSGYSSTPWTVTQNTNSINWASETFVQNQNANAIRWGALYNFRFDSDRPPELTNATVGFLKTGAPVQVQIQSPSSGGPTPTPTPTPTPGQTQNVQGYLYADGVRYGAGNALVTITHNGVIVQQQTARAGDGLFAFVNAPVGGIINVTAPGYTFPSTTIDGVTELYIISGVSSASFQAVLVAGNISNPTAMAFAPDGRLFVCQQTGQLRVISGGVLLPDPFVTLNVNSSSERGLLGVAFDPNFANNQFVYVYYTTATAPIHNRVSRFTANGNVAVVGSELPLVNLENLGAGNHNGGAIHFGPDGKLYIAVGENAVPSNAQTLSNRLGKILRINSDGSIPEDNPFFGTATGDNRSIWALGLRNPFTFGFQPGTGRMFINDVGELTWEEINDGIAGSNYGWNICEGTCGNPGFRNPLFTYGHGGGSTTGCAITGAAFYNPPIVAYPPEYLGKYFFADLCSGWIRTFDPATSTAAPFRTGLTSPVDLQVGPDGNLYYLVRGGGGAVFKITYS